MLTRRFANVRLSGCCLTEQVPVPKTPASKSSLITMGSCDIPVTSNFKNANTLEETKMIWKTADAVCFDVDSTVCIDEGIDELAKFVGKGDEVAALTMQAMRGGMKFQDALRIRLNVIRPTMNVLQGFLNSNPPRLTPYIKDLVSLLHKNKVCVYLISGGFTSVVEPVAKMLEIPIENTFCNRLKFYYNGDYAGFDETEPTAHSGGKGEVIQLLKNRHNYKRLVMIGDGATDMEAAPPADAFIGFGGNQIRHSVKQGATWFATDFRELINELNQPENNIES